jgi:hypothetical protein
VSECDREASILRRLWPTRSCWAVGRRMDIIQINTNRLIHCSRTDVLLLELHTQYHHSAQLIVTADPIMNHLLFNL